MLKVVGASWFQTRVSTCIVGVVSALGILAVILGEIGREEDDGIYSATVFWSENAGFHIDFWGQGNEMEEIPYGVGRAYYKQEIDVTGWAVLEIETRDEYADWVQAYSAGLLEGSLTWQLIHWHWQNTVQNVCEDQMEFCIHVRSSVAINSEKIKDLAEKNGDSDPFWHQVHLFYVQLDGLETGWRHGVKRSRQDIDISHLDFLWMNIVSDLVDMEQIYNSALDDTKHPFIFSTAASFSSAFVKFHAETGELYAAHNSGGLFQSMLRVLKCYQLSYHHTSETASHLVPGQVITFSSYPGVIHSQDDFYLVSGRPQFGKRQHQLAILGTAFNFYNRTSLGSFAQEEQVLIGPRAMAANRLAQGGRFWGWYLRRANSGTGSKQWLIVDYSLIAGTEAITALPMNKKVSSQLLSNPQSKQQNVEKTPKVSRGLLWVVEQLSGLTHYADETHTLQTTGFWISNGLPYYQDNTRKRRTGTAEGSGSQALYYGQEVAVNLTSVMQLMRNNTFLLNSHLVPPDNSSSPMPYNLPPMGTIDSKIVVASPFQKTKLHVISGPPNMFVENSKNDSSENIKFLGVPFQWSKSRFANKTHIGLPDLWKFNAVQPQWFWA
ncbi:hypothetical protein B7P43_G10043 [Cryptotermes secundus]|uniref:Phospholipase B-like n=1 Tax=Cryptotermes secundus TaxID=105785 RepID=A0A2J7Q5T1_9NEOP|nr:putative phospholipase B-like lamina ancestor [Cryptotermes secundus]PNF23940.1 hypothetical protein B7P43_G10043 [Cryptotermes secundus]